MILSHKAATVGRAKKDSSCDTANASDHVNNTIINAKTPRIITSA